MGKKGRRRSKKTKKAPATAGHGGRPDAITDANAGAELKTGQTGDSCGKSHTDQQPRGATTTTSTTTGADLTASALPSPCPSVLRNLVSTTADPASCALCSKPMPPEDCNYYYLLCCGRHCCHDHCGDAEYLDLLGDERCTFCNAQKSKRLLAVKDNAHLGKPWAQYHFGMHCKEANPSLSFHFFEKAAAVGHPEACLDLAEAFISGEPLPTVGYWDGNRYHRWVGPDLQKATRYAQKAKTVYTGFAVEANRYLSWIALEHVNNGEMDAARALVTGDLGHGTGANFLDADTCESIAIVHREDDQHRSAGDFFCQGVLSWWNQFRSTFGNRFLQGGRVLPLQVVARRCLQGQA